MSIKEVPDVEIDDSGIFKYVLIKATDKDNQSKNIVRGNASAEYHANVFEKTEKELKKKGISTECLGGGRIERNGNVISVYGHSIGYGKADHEVTVSILKKAFPSSKLTWSNEGY
ncbi:hypothetical protein RvY_04300 [Ramazzottius varieornatus]|uniref:Uncharacterized protein n=1 Tax=Ramazzottius varieornatus TaxID=947166 RepID=A0A1D1UY16_RAMVA|nr:hypothetical protein RvY_04300 [Ramazzottius varieornatus]